MDLQSKFGNEIKFTRTQELLNEMNDVWGKIDRIEKAAKKILDKGNPILESVGFAWVHMMNASIEIENNLNLDAGSRLEPKTLSQVIDVLTRIELSGAKSWGELIDVYQISVREVAKFNKIHRNTIADACTRRLNLKGRDVFLDLVEKWLTKDSKELEQIVRSHCRASERDLIHEFFHKKGAFRENHLSRPKTD